MKARFLLQSLSIGAAIALAGCGADETQNGGGFDPEQTEGAMRNEMETEEMRADQQQARAQGDDPATEALERAEAVTELPDPVSATVINTEGDPIGNVVIERLQQGVQLDLHAEGLNPGKHAVHFHARGTCEPPDFASAGSHYDPADAEHGRPDSDEQMKDQDHHAGDMLNQVVDDNGTLDTLIVNQSVTLEGGQNPLLDDDGSALVIHAQADDYETQPAGDAGNRVACAEITAQA